MFYTTEETNENILKSLKISDIRAAKEYKEFFITFHAWGGYSSVLLFPLDREEYTKDAIRVIKTNYEELISMFVKHKTYIYFKSFFELKQFQKEFPEFNLLPNNSITEGAD